MTIEGIMFVYGLQCKFYNNKRIAFNSLSEKYKEAIRINRHEVIDEIDRVNAQEVKDAKRKSKSKYYALCWDVTNVNAKDAVNIEKRKYREYDVDHIVPISYGFRHDIPYWVIGSKENLRIISNKDNFQKGSSLVKESTDLLEKWDSELAY
jgi:hypothetical protein